MRTIVVYSSKTGNTKKVAEAIASVLPEGSPCVSAKELPEDLASYDLVFAGFWVDRGHANTEAEKVIENLKNKNVALFGTLGAFPNTPHGAISMDAAIAKLPEGVNLAGNFMCQGAVDPKLIEMMYKQFAPGSSHGQSAERDALHAEAAKHPDDEDLANAKKFALDTLAKLEG